MEVVLNWVLDNVPWMAPTIVAVILTWKISRWKHSMDDIKQKVSEIPCAQYKRDIEANKQEIDKEMIKTSGVIERLADRIEAMECKLDRWESKMIERALSAASSVKKNSPYSLTDMGQILLRESGGDRCIEDHKAYYYSEIDKMPHGTPFDVERATISVVLDSFGIDVTNTVKDYMYNTANTIVVNGEEQIFTLNDLQMAMAIYLRDMYLRDNNMD